MVRKILSYKIKGTDLYLLNKRNLSSGLFTCAILLSFWTSLNPWFLWPLGTYYVLLEVPLLLAALFLIKSCPNPEPENPHFIIPALGYAFLTFEMLLTGPGDVTAAAILGWILRVTSFFLIFKVNGEMFKKALVITSKSLSAFLVLSITAFCLYIIGFQFPCVDAVYGDGRYYFSNYFLFMIDEMQLWAIIPRFNSVFLEPSHIGVAAVFLLMADCGRWKKWNNIVLIITVLITFSLESYVLLFVLVFLSKWLQREKFMRNLMILVVFFSSVVIGSFFYNNGENLLNELIVARLEYDEDKGLSGNNRTSDSFDVEFESFLNSSDVLFGRDMPMEFGNSGYKVYTYEHGIVGVLFLFMFYAGIFFYHPRQWRAAIVATALWSIHFVVRAHMTWDSTIFVMYFMAQVYEVPKISSKKIKQESNVESGTE